MDSASIIFTAPRRAEVVIEPQPDPGPGQVTVKALVSLISTGTESWCYRGEFDADSGWASWVKYPFHPGYSHVGEVIKVGEGVTNLSPGDRVFSTVSHRQFANVPDHSVKLPDYTTDEEAAWAWLSVITQTAVRRAKHSLGDTAVVIGLGPLGQLLTQYLRVLGLREVLAVDTEKRRLDVALDHGATRAFHGLAQDARDFVLEYTEGRLADVVYDVTGHYSVFSHALRLARDWGTVVLVGDTPHPSRQHLTHDLLTRQLHVLGTQNDRLGPGEQYWTSARQIQLFFEYIHRGQMRVKDLVTHRFPPTEAAGVYEFLEQSRGETLGVLFDWRNL